MPLEIEQIFYNQLRAILLEFPDRAEETLVHLASWVGVNKAIHYFTLIESEARIETESPEF